MMMMMRNGEENKLMSRDVSLAEVDQVTFQLDDMDLSDEED